MRHGPVTVNVAGHPYEIPAADWWPPLASCDPFAIVPGLLDPADAHRLALAVVREEADLFDVVEGSAAAIEAVTHLPWHVAYRLAGYLEESLFDARAWHASHTGADLLDHLPAVALALAWRYRSLSALDETERVITGAATKDKHERKAIAAFNDLRREVWAPPLVDAAESRFDPKAEAALAAQLMGSLMTPP